MSLSYSKVISKINLPSFILEIRAHASFFNLSERQYVIALIFLFFFFLFGFQPLSTDVCGRARRTMKSLWTKPEAALMNTRLGALNCFCLIWCKAITRGSSVWSGGGPFDPSLCKRVHESASRSSASRGARRRVASLRLLCMSSHQLPGAVKSSVRRDAGEPDVFVRMHA